MLLVNEAYKSKTCSWSGEIIPDLGGRRVVTGSDGLRVDRDINCAAGYSCGLWEIHLPCAASRRNTSAPMLLALVSENVSVSVDSHVFEPPRDIESWPVYFAGPRLYLHQNTSKTLARNR